MLRQFSTLPSKHTPGAGTSSIASTGTVIIVNHKLRVHELLAWTNSVSNPNVRALQVLLHVRMQKPGGVEDVWVGMEVRTSTCAPCVLRCKIGPAHAPQCQNIVEFAMKKQIS